MASFLLVDEVPVVGLSLAELDTKLTERFATVVRQPDLTILVKTLTPRKLVVMGEVKRSGEVLVEDGRITFESALGRAGGPLKETAHLESTLLVRWIPSEQRQVVWKIDANRELWGNPTALFLQPNDVVFVPNTGIDRVDIWVDKYIRQLLPFPGFSPTIVGGI
jgi:protein involved in polysaccharide export with SLBB domain